MKRPGVSISLIFGGPHHMPPGTPPHSPIENEMMDTPAHEAGETAGVEGKEAAVEGKGRGKKANPFKVMVPRKHRKSGISSYSLAKGIGPQ